MPFSVPSGRLVCVLFLLGCLAGACADDAPVESATTAPAIVKADLIAAPARPAVGSLDPFGNLRGSDQAILGFELPAGAQTPAGGTVGRVVYVESNLARLLRFYRSRGHALIKTPAAWRIGHTDRSLRSLGTDGVAYADGVIHVDQGPGPGFTLRFESGKAVELPKPALRRLIEAERAQAKKKRQAGIGAGAAADGSGKIEALRQESFQRRGKRPGRRVRDLSKHIYEYMKAHPDEPYRD